MLCFGKPKGCVVIEVLYWETKVTLYTLISFLFDCPWFERCSTFFPRSMMLRPWLMIHCLDLLSLVGHLIVPPLLSKYLFLSWFKHHSVASIFYFFLGKFPEKLAVVTTFATASALRASTLCAQGKIFPTV